MFRNHRTLQSIPPVSLLAFALEGSLGIEAIGMGAARTGIQSALIYIYTIISATDIFQFKTNVTFAVVASKCVHTSSIRRTDCFARSTFIDI